MIAYTEVTIFEAMELVGGGFGKKSGRPMLVAPLPPGSGARAFIGEALAFVVESATTAQFIISFQRVEATK